MNSTFLRALEPDDYLITHTWRLDEFTWDSVVGLKRFVSLETERKWVLNAIESHEAGKVLRFVICTNQNSDPAGLVTLSDIDLINRSAAVSYMVSPNFRGQGLASSALRKVIEYAFSELALVRVSCKILEDNLASQALVAKMGMVKEGVLRKAVFKSGEFRNLLCFSILKDEFAIDEAGS
ncbi:MAG: GNAT family N-acetyltransferase [Marinospirillum sp.]|uniref:GNAT family N-acetyltransferase n=1 Tax=Marinospirillum sp. TaxID=2183934 RepID=UPI0019F3BE71|nr:GNAT family protein [Marinospirillum sp.]MBE0508067.1 GNAT family N-acetyltransferase [Marinospirillum sp.]